MCQTRLRTTGTTRTAIEPSELDLVACDQPTRAQHFVSEALCVSYYLNRLFCQLMNNFLHMMKKVVHMTLDNSVFHKQVTKIWWKGEDQC